MNEITLTVNIKCPEIAAAINSLASALGSGKEGVVTQVSAVSSAPALPVVPAVPVSTTPAAPPAPVAPVAPVTTPVVPLSPAAVVPVAPAAAPAASVPTSIPSYTIEQLQTALAPLLDVGKAPQLQQLVQSFGVNTLMEIPPARYGEFANGIRALGGVI